MRAVLLLCLMGCIGPTKPDGPTPTPTPDTDGPRRDSTPGWGGDTNAVGDTGDTPDEDSSLVSDSADDTADTDAPAGTSDIVGAWVSQNADLSAVLVAAGVTRAEVSFQSDGTYTAFHAAPTGDVTYIGTWFLNDTANPVDLTIVQTLPEVAALNGVAMVVSDVLMLDVMQTTPTIGETAATQAGGVGSSSLGADNVQTFR